MQRLRSRGLAFIDDGQARNRQGLARGLITAAGGDAKRAEADIETALSKRAQVQGGSGQLYLDGDTARVFAAAEQAAKKAGDQFVTTERLLQGLAKEEAFTCPLSPGPACSQCHELFEGIAVFSDQPRSCVEAG